MALVLKLREPDDRNPGREAEIRPRKSCERTRNFCEYGLCAGKKLK